MFTSTNISFTHKYVKNNKIQVSIQTYCKYKSRYGNREKPKKVTILDKCTSSPDLTDPHFKFISKSSDSTKYVKGHINRKLSLV